MKKSGLSCLPGKTVASVVFAQREEGDMRKQVFLVFTDGTWLEFYGTAFSCTSGLSGGGIEKAIAYAKNCGSQVKHVQHVSPA